MTLEIAIFVGAALFFVVTVYAVRWDRRRQVVPTYVTKSCAQCGTTIEPGEGSLIRGDMYCSDGCARWAW